MAVIAVTKPTFIMLLLLLFIMCSIELTDVMTKNCSGCYLHCGECDI